MQSFYDFEIAVHNAFKIVRISLSQASFVNRRHRVSLIIESIVTIGVFVGHNIADSVDSMDQGLKAPVLAIDRFFKLFQGIGEIAIYTKPGTHPGTDLEAGGVTVQPR